MSSLDSLFAGDQATRLVEAARAEGRLDAMVGTAAPSSAPVDHVVERQRLQQLVGAAGGVVAGADPRAVAALPAAVETRTKARSRFLRRQRRDWLAVASAAVAIIAIVGASFVGVRAAVASTPTDDARTLLEFGEEALASSVAGVNTERKRVEATRADMMAAAELSAATLASLAGTADEALRQSALAARDAYVAEVNAISVPAEVAPFEAKNTASDASLAEIGAALEAVNARQVEADAVHQELRDLRKALESKRDAYRLTVAPLADSMIALATAALGENVEALPEFRVAVQNAVDAFAAARTTGRVGWVEMQALGAAIIALRADDERAISEAADQESGSAWRPPSDGSGTTPDPGTTDPGPADPGPVDPGPTDPGPADPGVTEPAG